MDSRLLYHTNWYFYFIRKIFFLRRNIHLIKKDFIFSTMILQHITYELSFDHTVLEYLSFKTDILVAALSFMKSFHEFWFGIRTEFPIISEMDYIYLPLQSCATYLCKMSFSELVILKSKYWSTLKSIEDSIFCSVKYSAKIHSFLFTSFDTSSSYVVSC